MRHNLTRPAVILSPTSVPVRSQFDRICDTDRLKPTRTYQNYWVIQRQDPMWSNGGPAEHQTEEEDNKQDEQDKLDK